MVPVEDSCHSGQQERGSGHIQQMIGESLSKTVAALESLLGAPPGGVGGGGGGCRGSWRECSRVGKALSVGVGKHKTLKGESLCVCTGCRCCPTRNVSKPVSHTLHTCPGPCLGLRCPCGRAPLLLSGLTLRLWPQAKQGACPELVGENPAASVFSKDNFS